MIDVLARYWWAVALRGVTAVLFGIVAIVLPGITLTVLAALFGAYVLIEGVFGVLSGVRAFQRQHTWWPFMEGLVSIAIGIVALFFPWTAALGLLFVIGWWAIITGVLEIVQAVRLRNEVDNEWTLALAGVLSLVFGVFVLIVPAVAAVAILWIIGGYGIVFGIVLIALSLRLRGMLGEPAAG